ncbi:MAG: anhydro-N-acetylmuramic acid kinase, partial [Candidatus Methylomirabilaceae bacterium]
LKQIRRSLPACRLLTADEAGFPTRAIEATAFALLAYLTANGVPGNLPSVTGATHPVVLGKIIPGLGFRALL